MLSAMTYIDENVNQSLNMTRTDKISCVHLGMGVPGIWRGDQTAVCEELQTHMMWLYWPGICLPIQQF